MEGLWETRPRRAVHAVRDSRRGRRAQPLSRSRSRMLGSLYPDARRRRRGAGLKDWPPDERPPVAIVFFAFRIMVGIGLLMLAIVALGWLLRWRGRLYDTPRFLRLCQWSMPLGFVAVLAGWVDDRGRPPALGGLRTDAHRATRVTPSLTGVDVLVSLLPSTWWSTSLVYPAGAHLHRPHRAQGGRRGPRRPTTVADRERPAARGRVDALPAGMPAEAPVTSWPSTSSPLWTVHPRPRRVHVRAARRLRPRRRHPVSASRRADAARDLMMNSVAPVWDGNETWLVLGGIALLAAFPLAFAIIIPALYFPILIMLLGLVFRGVAFEFRHQAKPTSRPSGTTAFCYGSLVATFAQGRRARRLRPGLRGRGPHFRRHVVRLGDAVLAADRRRPCCSATRCSAPAGWCIKTEGELQDWARRMGAARLDRRCWSRSAS